MADKKQTDLCCGAPRRLWVKPLKGPEGRGEEYELEITDRQQASWEASTLQAGPFPHPTPFDSQPLSIHYKIL